MLFISLSSLVNFFSSSSFGFGRWHFGRRCVGGQWDTSCYHTSTWRLEICDTVWVWAVFLNKRKADSESGNQWLFLRVFSYQWCSSWFTQLRAPDDPACGERLYLAVFKKHGEAFFWIRLSVTAGVLKWPNLIFGTTVFFFFYVFVSARSVPAPEFSIRGQSRTSPRAVLHIVCPWQLDSKQYTDMICSSWRGRPPHTHPVWAVSWSQQVRSDSEGGVHSFCFPDFCETMTPHFNINQFYNITARLQREHTQLGTTLYSCTTEDELKL